MGGSGKKQLVDWLIIFHCIWASIALFHAHGLSGAWEAAGIYMIEVLGGYFIARSYIQTQSDFRYTCKILFILVIILLPFAILESFFGNYILREIFGGVPAGSEPRFGLLRAQTSMAHPILFGVFCATAFPGLYYVMSNNSDGRRFIIGSAIITLATFLSLSTGALVALLTQFALVAWDRLTQSIQRRWRLLGGLFAAAWILVSLASNRGPVRVFIWYLSFNRDSSYNRILIWEYGTAEVARHPIFGIGFGDWIRAPWMSDSVDNFWLLEAMRFGLPAAIALVGGVAWIIVRLARQNIIVPELNDCRMAYMITMAGLIISGATVHFFGVLFPYFFFVMGGGVWMISEKVNKRTPS